MDASGRAVYVVRLGRVIVGTTHWTMYAQPVSGEAFNDTAAQTRLGAMLEAAKA